MSEEEKTPEDLLHDLVFAAKIRKSCLEKVAKIQRDANEAHTLARAEAKKLRVTSSLNLLEQIAKVQARGISMKLIAKIVGVTPATIYKLKKSLEKEETSV